ncbi:phosphate butyryltransferase [Sutcliffiella rhizosphaerae]|uniref:Phosphate acetyltransferase n=1 Tax=Sutcliffiella rhizosphaerae TaxID=2880967 RepID=A0ABM8YT63_9BACI|nr:phosphate butyryltransferase [Sutcliffiella rhizosphaerae]CAG9623214.1 Phosphate acetyltransferase [Sutcliffiella rhizosphaerae]
MKLEELITKATQLTSKVVAIAAAEDEEVIEAVSHSLNKQLASFILFGNEGKITALLEEHQIDLKHSALKIVPANGAKKASELAVKAVTNGEADVLMKGNVPTAIILKEVLNKEYGMRTGNVLSHVAAFEVPGYDKLVFVTDAAMNVEPDINQKVQIVQNSVQVARGLGIEIPKVAPLAAVEVVNPAMQATVDAALLTQMNNRGQIKDCIVDGPLALDIAMSVLAAEHKGIKSDVAGHADILFVPTIEVGNVLYKSLIYFARAKVGAIIAGAKAPVVLTSRADTAESKLYSLALAVCSVK